MKSGKFTLNMFAMAGMLIAFTGCSTPKALLFANRDWHISDYYGQIIDRDTTYRMTFGNVLIPVPLTIVSSADSAAKYPGMNKFLSDILNTVQLDSQEDTSPMKPSSISSPLYDDKPYTMWINEDDIEEWIRKPLEMYTYTYFDKRKRRLLIVDCYDYGDAPIAQITIFQSKNSLTSKMNVPDALRKAFYETHDLKYYIRGIEFWAHNIEMRRWRAIANYKIGQEQKLRNK